MPGLASVAILPRAALKRRWGILSRREGAAAVVPGHQQIPGIFSIVLSVLSLTHHYGQTVRQTQSRCWEGTCKGREEEGEK